MIVILNRDEIEEAIQVYVRDKLLPYGDKRPVHVVQERKVTAKITFGEDIPERTEALPGMTEEDLKITEPEVECEPEVEYKTEPMPVDKTEAMTVDNPLGV